MLLPRARGCRTCHRWGTWWCWPSSHRTHLRLVCQSLPLPLHRWSTRFPSGWEGPTWMCNSPARQSRGPSWHHSSLWWHQVVDISTILTNRPILGTTVASEILESWLCRHVEGNQPNRLRHWWVCWFQRQSHHPHQEGTSFSEEWTPQYDFSQLEKKTWHHHPQKDSLCLLSRWPCSPAPGALGKGLDPGKTVSGLSPASTGSCSALNCEDWPKIENCLCWKCRPAALVKLFNVINKHILCRIVFTEKLPVGFWRDLWCLIRGCFPSQV